MLGKTKGKSRRRMRRLRWLDGIADNGHESGRSPGDAEGPGSLACMRSPGAGHDLVTKQQQQQRWV